MAADALVFYDSFREYMADGTIDLDGDTFKAILVLSSYTPSVSGHSTYADITNEHANGNGYTTGGVTVAATWVESSGIVTFDIADPSWTASGGNLVARYCVIYDDTPSSPANPLVGYYLMDNSPADVTQVDGGTLTVQIPSGGLFTLADAA